MKRYGLYALACAVCFVAAAHAQQEETWRKDLGKEASPLTAAGWTGTPVSLDALRGNAVTLAFWNADVAC